MKHLIHVPRNLLRVDQRCFNKTCLTCDPSSYHRHPSSPEGQPWVAPVPPWHLPPRAWPNSVDPNGVLLSQTGTPAKLNYPLGSQDYHRLPDQGSMPCITLPSLVVPTEEHKVIPVKAVPYRQMWLHDNPGQVAHDQQLLLSNYFSGSSQFLSI